MNNLEKIKREAQEIANREGKDVNLRHTLLHAVTVYDKKQEAKAKKGPRGYYNVYALPQYLGRVQDVLSDIEKGKPMRAAIIAGFTPGPLLNALLRAVKADPFDPEKDVQRISYLKVK